MIKSIEDRLILYGTGSISGVPVHMCNCEICMLARGDRRFIRRQPTYIINYGGKTIFLDIGSQDVLREPIISSAKIDAIILSHTHLDHTGALFSLRWSRQKGIPVFYPAGTELVDGFDKLIFTPSFIGPFHEVVPYREFKIGEELKVTGFELNHTVYTLGYLIESDSFSIAYISDTKGLSDKTLNFLKSREIDLVLIDAMYPPKWDLKDHNNIDEALEILKFLNFGKAFLIHISHLYQSYDVVMSRIGKYSHEMNGEVFLSKDLTAVELKPPFKVHLK